MVEIDIGAKARAVGRREFHSDDCLPRARYLIMRDCVAHFSSMTAGMSSATKSFFIVHHVVDLGYIYVHLQTQEAVQNSACTAM